MERGREMYLESSERSAHMVTPPDWRLGAARGTRRAARGWMGNVVSRSARRMESAGREDYGSQRALLRRRGKGAPGEGAADSITVSPAEDSGEWDRVWGPFLPGGWFAASPPDPQGRKGGRRNAERRACKLGNRQDSEGGRRGWVYWKVISLFRPFWIWGSDCPRVSI